MKDIGLHLVLFALVGLGIVVLSAVFSEVDDVRALKTVPKRLLLFAVGCGLLVGILLALEHTVARVS